MATPEARIKVNVLGRVFEISVKTAESMSYFVDMWHDCGTREGEIYIERSATLFEQVIAFIVDDTYPFPAIYEQELRFYGVPYKRESLYNVEKETLDTLIAHHLETREAAQLFAQKVDNLTVHNKQVEVVIRDLCKMTVTPHPCRRCYGVKGSYRGRSSTCKGCSPYCIVDGCKEKTKNQYCDLHVDRARYCIKKDCLWNKLPNSAYCIEHIVT